MTRKIPLAATRKTESWWYFAVRGSDLGNEEKFRTAATAGAADVRKDERSGRRGKGDPRKKREAKRKPSRPHFPEGRPAVPELSGEGAAKGRSAE